MSRAVRCIITRARARARLTVLTPVTHIFNQEQGARARARGVLLDSGNQVGEYPAAAVSVVLSSY